MWGPSKAGGRSSQDFKTVRANERLRLENTLMLQNACALKRQAQNFREVHVHFSGQARYFNFRGAVFATVACLQRPLSALARLREAVLVMALLAMAVFALVMSLVGLVVAVVVSCRLPGSVVGLVVVPAPLVVLAYAMVVANLLPLLVQLVALGLSATLSASPDVSLLAIQSPTNPF
eukprot:s1694_g20.t1